MTSEAGSVSSFGSSRHSTVERLASHKPGDDEDVQSSWVAGLFGVLYTVSKEKDRQTWKFVLFRLALDALQLFLLTVNPQYGWDISPDSTIWRVVSFIQLNQFMTDRGYSFFLIIFYIMVVALVAVVALCIWVGWSFSLSRFDYVWPITLLRWYANIFFQVLEVASMTLLLMALDCQYFDVKEGQQFIQQEFGVGCWAMPHVIHVIVASVSLVAFVGLAALFQMAEMELNPLSHNYLSIGHSKVELQGFALKVFMTFSSVFITNYKWLSIIYLVCTLMLVRLYVFWQPHLYPWVNHVRSGSYAAVLYSAVLLIAIAFKPSSADDLFTNYVTIAMWAGLAPAALVGAIASHMRLRFFNVTVLDRFRMAPPGTKPRHIFRFFDARQAEILARCCRQWIEGDDEMLDQEAVKLAERVLKAGMALLPKDAFMIILYSSFMIEVQSSYQSGYTQLQAAKRADPSFLERFAIYSREQQHTQKSSGAGGGAAPRNQSVSLVSFVEFTKNYRLVLRVHREALVALRQFWQHLLHSEAKLIQLTRSVKRIDHAIRNADRVYKMVLTRHMQNVRIVKLYARFLEDVKHDPWNASKWFLEAEKLEQAEEDARNGNIFAELGIDPGSADLAALGDLGELLNMKGGILGAADSRSVIIINAQGTVQLVNPTVERMFGYTKNEVKGRNVAAVIPPPFAEHHTSFIRNYVQTGREVVIGSNTTFVALHKERYVFGVQLQVTKIAGLGEDSLFMGVVTANPVSPGATIWVMVGSEAVVSCDSTFTDWFGYRADELLGKGVDEWLVDATNMQDIFKQAKARAMRSPSMTDADDSGAKLGGDSHPDRVSLSGGHRMSEAGGASVRSRRQSAVMENTWTLSNVLLRHKYAESCVADVHITVGGIGSHKFFVCNVRLQGDPRLLIVSDKGGRVLHASMALANALNTTPKAILSNGNPGALQNLMPQPFSTLHTLLLTMPLPQGAPPLHSCRAGALAILLNAATKDGPPVPKPFNFMLTRKELEGDYMFVSTFKNIAMDEALNQRRVKLVVALDGKVVEVQGGDAAVFGFDPIVLLDKQCGEFLDILQNCYTVAPDDGPAQEGMIESGMGVPSPSLEKVLLAMAAKVHESPGTSFRVGVSAPHERMHDHMGLDDDITAVLGTSKPKSAIMSVSVHVVRASSYLTAMSISKVARANTNMSLGTALNYEGTMSMNGGTMGPHGPMSMNGGLMGPLGGAMNANGGLMGPSGSMQRKGMEEDAGPSKRNTIMFTVELWRADVATGVLEVDSAGYIVNSHHLPIYPAGLVFGVPSDIMLGQPLSTYLPMAEGKPLASILQQGWGGGVADRSGKAAGNAPKPKPSSMKTSKTSARNKHLVGAMNVVRVNHFTDGEPLDVMVQAVHKLGGGYNGGNNMFIILRPKNPRLGRSDFATWLVQSRAKVKRQAALSPALPAPGPALSRVPEETASGGGTERTRDRVFNKRSSIRSIQTGEPFAPTPPPLPPPPPPPPPQEDPPPHDADWDMDDITDAAELAAAAARKPAEAAELSSARGPKKKGLGELAAEGSISRVRFAGPGAAASDQDQPPSSTEAAAAPPPPPPPPHPHPAVSQAAKDATLSPKSSSPRNSSPRHHHHRHHHHHHEPSPLRPQAGPPAKPPSDSGPSQPMDRIAMWVMSGGQTLDSAAPPPPDRPHSASRSGSDSGSIPEEEDAGNHSRHSSSRGGSSGSGSESPRSPGDAGRVVVAQKADDTSSWSDKGDTNPYNRYLNASEEDLEGGYRDDGQRDSSDKQSSEPLEGGADEAIMVTDYRRGQRFKKLMRLLNGTEAQASMRRFRLHAYCVAVGMVVVHMAMFVLQHRLLIQQETSVNNLYSIGIAARCVGQILHTTREMELVLSNRTIASLPGLASYDDFSGVQSKYFKYIDELKVLHAGVYLGFDGTTQRMPDQFGLRKLWDENSLSVADYIDTKYTTTIVTRNMSLWTLGNTYIAKASNIWLNGQAFSWANGTLEKWGDFKFIMANGPTVLIPGYYDTMDAFLQLVIQQAHSISRTQVIVLVMEGALVSVVAITYIVLLARSVTWQRFNLFNVFIMVPIGLVRSLATQVIILDEEDEEAAEVDNLGKIGQTNVAVGAAPSGDAWDSKKNTAANKAGDGTGMGMVKISVRMAVPDTEKGERGSDRNLTEKKGVGATSIGKWFSTLKKAILATLSPGRGQKANPSGKRKLSSTYRFAIWLSWPFLLWAVINIAINATSRSEGVDGSVATFNLVNTLAVRFQRVFNYAQELCATSDLNEKQAIRIALKTNSLPLMELEYQAVLRGSEGVPNETKPHFVLATEGVLYAAGRGVGILFYTTECLRENKTSCAGHGTNYYEYTHNGLDRLLRKFMEVVETMAMYTGPDPLLDSSEFNFLWNTRDDVEGGLSQLDSAFADHVIAIYEASGRMHTANFAISVVIATIYAFFILRPFIDEVHNETRRVAELLSQLPSEIAVEDLVSKALMLQANNAIAAALPEEGADDGPHMTAQNFGKGSSFAKRGSFKRDTPNRK